jgi:flagellar hook-basal body complex protein FliE
MKETERALVEKVAHLFSVDDKGVVDFDKEKAAQILNSDEMESGYNPLYILRDMAKTATAIIKDILSIGSQSDPKAQSQKLSEVAAGRGKSGLGFEDFLKVVVQLVSKENISAQVYVATDKRVKGEKDINQNYVITGSTQAENAMNEMTQMRDRFSDPSKLSD